MQASHTPQTTHLEQKKEKGQNKETQDTWDGVQLSYSNTKKINITKEQRLQQHAAAKTSFSTKKCFTLEKIKLIICTKV